MDKTLGIYIHIPFCASKCGYCDFYSVTGTGELAHKYQRALCHHISEASPQIKPYLTDTVYFGGGTPSLYGARRLCELLNVIKREARLLKTAEITVEMNPDSVRPRDLDRLRSEGFNRVSLGVQSMNDQLLKIIGRRHSAKQTTKAIAAIRSAGFDNLSLDLIYGLPGQTKGDWADTLARAISFCPEHLSCYGLKLEEGVPMYEAYAASPLLPDDDEQADMYLYTVETLESYGYNRYEISNFALNGRESRHNLKYWDLDDYVGFGAGAHSFVGGVRYSYLADAREYSSRVDSGESPLDEYEEITQLGLATEYLMLGLRRSRGISRDEYRAVYRADFDQIETVLDEFRKNGWVTHENNRWCFTSAGMLRSNLLIGALLEIQAESKLSGTPWIKDAISDEERLMNA